MNTAVDTGTTCQLSYGGPAGDVSSPITGLAQVTRSFALTGLTNFTIYSITLNGMVSGSPVLTDTVSLMPTDLLLYLPLTSR